MEARMASALALSRGGGGGRGVGERACRPCGATGVTRLGARGAAVSEHGRREWTRARGGRAGFASWAGWLAPARQ